MKYLSLFSGIGGFELGIIKAYEHLDNRGITETSALEERWDKSEPNPSDGNGRRANPTCIGYSEIDKYATQIYEKHFPQHKALGDITKLNVSELPDFDLLVGGFPCQAFSIAGKRRGFDDTRGTLFFDIARILKEKRPRNFILENVKGLLSHDNGRTFKTIISTLVELGYCVEWQILNAKNFGVPQNRERVFIVGHLGGIPERKVFPIGYSDNKIDTEQLTSTAIDSNYWKGIDNHGQRTSIVMKGMLSDEKWDKFNESSRRVYDPKGISPTLPTVAGGGHTPKIDVKEIEETLALSGLEITEKGYESLDNINKIRVRRLTPLECERLMGFEDRWCDGLSDTQKYKCLGNAVVSNVVEEVVKKLYV